jgi:YhgE/Pip-like protein
MEPVAAVAGPLTARKLMARRRTLVMPAIAAGVVVALMTLVYFGSIVDPAAHLRGLPVAIVDEDLGATSATGPVDIGREVTASLTGNTAITSRLALIVQSLPAADARMDRGAAFATVVIPADFTSSILALTRAADVSPLPAVAIMTNIRAGSIGVSLAEAVLEPALSSVSASIGKSLEAKGSSSSAPTALLAHPVAVSVQTYRPVASHAGLGLSAFYFGLLVMMCGFLTAIIVNTFIDSDLGYAVSEFGPRWRQQPPQPISRWQTLLTKWLTALPVALLTSGLLILVAAGIFGMDAPDWFGLWMYAWFAATTVATGTLVFLAALGSLGQILALLVFVYLGLASSGGTIPLQALGGFFRFVANFEPLRQIVGAVRAILYFNAAGDAGLDRGLVLTTAGFVLWIVVGAAVALYYDKRGLDRMPDPHPG